MKSSILKFGMIIVMLLSYMHVSAYDFEVDGIYYNVLSLSDLTCEVTYNESNKRNGNLYFLTTDGRTNCVVTLYTYPSYSGIVNIPAVVTYKGRELSVVGIGEYAFLNCSNLTSVSLPASISSISEVTLDNNRLYAGAFDYCNIQTLNAGNAYILKMFNQSYASSSGYNTKDNLKNLILSDDFWGTIGVNFSND